MILVTTFSDLGTWPYWLCAVLIPITIGYIIKLLFRPFKKSDYDLRCEDLFFGYYSGKDTNGIKTLLMHDGSIINDTVIQDSFKIINSGKNDISNVEIFNPLTIEIPEGFEILSVEIKANNSQISISHKISDNKRSLEILWDLLKSGNNFNVIITATHSNEDFNVKEASSFFNSLSFNIYAKGIKQIRKSQAIIEKEKQYYKYPMLIAVFLLGIMLLADSKYIPHVLPVKCEIVEESNHIINASESGVIVYDAANNKFVFTNDSIVRFYSIDDFDDHYEIRNITISKETIKDEQWLYKQKKILLYISICVIFISLAIFAYLLLYNYFTNKK